MLKERQTSEGKENKIAMQWKEIAGYEGLYLISDKGDVLSLPKIVDGCNEYGKIKAHRKAKLLKHHLRGNNGRLYPAVTLTKNNEPKAFSIHRLLALAFIPNPNGYDEVNHKDENTLNYSLDNLEWCDHQYNIEYSKNKAIAQYHKGKKIAEYKSIKYASKITGISRTGINNVLCGWSKSAGGYDWKYC